MNASIANLVYGLGVAALFYLNRDKSIRISRALWLPVIYLWVLGSRPVSLWPGAAPKDDIMFWGSHIDGVFLVTLLVGTLYVVIQRGSAFEKYSGPVTRCLSVLFSVFSASFRPISQKQLGQALLERIQSAA